MWSALKFISSLAKQTLGGAPFVLPIPQMFQHNLTLGSLTVLTYTLHLMSALVSTEYSTGTHMASCRGERAYLSSVRKVDSHHAVVERAATHSSIMLRSTRLGANSGRESNSGDSLAG